MIKFNAPLNFIGILYKLKIFHYLFSVNPVRFHLINGLNAQDISYSTFINTNRTSKQTSLNRFKDLEEITVEILRKVKNPKILDVGVSNGITTYELYKLLKKEIKHFQLHATDKYPFIFYVEKRNMTLILDDNQRIKSIYWGILFLSENLSWNYFLSKILFKISMPLISIKNFEIKKYYLFNQKFKKLIDKSEIIFHHQDIGQNFSQKNFHFIRIMNLLNLSYFHENEIESILKNIIQNIEDQGILLVGRTFKEQNKYSVFKKNKTKFNLIFNKNGGSEIEKLILNI